MKLINKFLFSIWTCQLISFFIYVNVFAVQGAGHYAFYCLILFFMTELKMIIFWGFVRK